MYLDGSEPTPNDNTSLLVFFSYKKVAPKGQVLNFTKAGGGELKFTQLH